MYVYDAYTKFIVVFCSKKLPLDINIAQPSKNISLTVIFHKTTSKTYNLINKNGYLSINIT